MGSTAEIAQAVAKDLTAAGLNAEAREMESVVSLAGYDGVVIGAPVYMGRVGSGPEKFLQRNKEALQKLPVATFTVGLAPVSGDPAGIGMDMKALRTALAPLKPVEETIFAGKLDPAKLSWFQRWIVKKVKSPVGDFRDWDAIAAWANELPEKMGL